MGLPELLGHVILHLPPPAFTPRARPRAGRVLEPRTGGPKKATLTRKRLSPGGPGGALCQPPGPGHPQGRAQELGNTQVGLRAGDGNPADPCRRAPGAWEARAEALGHTDPFLQSPGRSRQPGGPSGPPRSASCSLGRGLHLNELSPDREGPGAPLTPRAGGASGGAGHPGAWLPPALRSCGT